jgi:purine-binding chemotaxis protein CheW
MKKIDDLKDTTGGTRRFLTFRVAQRLYAVSAKSVAEVIRTPHVARVPQAPRALLGIANLRGAVLPIVSLRALLGLDDAREGVASRAIVLDGGAPVAIAVDAIDALIAVEPDRIESRPAQLGAEPGERLLGAFSLGEGRGAAKVIDVDSLFADAFAQRTRPGPNRQAGVGNAAATREGLSTSAHRDSLLTFDVAGQEFAFELGVVQEVVTMPESIAAMPRAEALVLGMMAFHAQLLPLLSLRGLLGFAPAPNSDAREKIIVVSVGSSIVGLVADRARAIVLVDPEFIDPVPPVLAARSSGEARIKAIYRGEKTRGLISILAPEQLFREDVMRQLGLADRVAQPQAQTAQGRDERKILVFRLGDDEFGLPVEAVDEVAEVPDKITRVPKTPKFLEGVINLRGEVLPVVDQRRRFDMPRLEQGGRRRLIVVRTERHRAGLIVDGVSQVLEISAGSLEAAPDLTGEITQLVHGVVNLEQEGRIVLLLDPAELLTRAERGLLDAFQSRARAPS